jgi:hypothetical protein
MTGKVVVVDLRVDQSMRVGDSTITLREKSGRRVKLVIEARPGVVIETPRDVDLARSGVGDPLQPR